MERDSLVQTYRGTKDRVQNVSLPPLFLADPDKEWKKIKSRAEKDIAALLGNGIDERLREELRSEENTLRWCSELIGKRPGTWDDEYYYSERREAMRKIYRIYLALSFILPLSLAPAETHA